MDIVNFVFLYLDIYCKKLLLYVLINFVIFYIASVKNMIFHDT